MAPTSIITIKENELFYKDPLTKEIYIHIDDKKEFVTIILNR